jgi:hypothetical protein
MSRRGFAPAKPSCAADRSARCHATDHRLIEALPPTQRSRAQLVGATAVRISRNHLVEAGARIGDVVRFALAHGWLLPVAPGHPRATIGGCIAADVHGKNPARDGTFRRHVEAIELFDPVSGWIAASAEENAGRFAACFAGFGIPGLIGSATLRLAPAAWAAAQHRRGSPIWRKPARVLLALPERPCCMDGMTG